MSALLAAVVWVAGFAAQVKGSQAAPREIRLEPTDETTDPSFVEIIGVGAGPFDPALWQAGTLNLVPDVRSPLLEPLPGKHRNIYAPSPVELDALFAR